MDQNNPDSVNSLHLSPDFSKPNIDFAKIVATPTQSAWSQVYNAGTLFAIIALTNEKTEEELGTIGKNMMNTLEEEFFTLEEKNLASIKKAIEKTADSCPESVSQNLVVAYIPQDHVNKVQKTILYVFVYNEGKILLKRSDSTAAILKLPNQTKDSLISASGLIKNEDVIVLETQQFAKLIPQDMLLKALEQATMSDVVETLAPKIHEEESGSAAAVFVSIKKIPHQTQSETETELINTETKPSHRIKNLLAQSTVSLVQKLSLLSTRFYSSPIHVSHTKKIYFSIAIAICIVLIASIFITVKKQRDAKTHILLQSFLDPAQHKYDEGMNLVNLNKNLARDDFLSAEKILKDGLSKFEKTSNEEKQISVLLDKTEEQLTKTSQLYAVNASRVDENKSSFLKIEKMFSSQSNFFTQNDPVVYFVSKQSVSSVDKNNLKPKELIKNDGQWSQVSGLGTYLNNIYVLDKKSGILKFTPSEDNYNKTNYFDSSQIPDLKNAKDMTIDGSIWILLENGTLFKYTKGRLDSFAVTGLDKPLSKALKIYTDKDIDNLYILDAGNNRIVKLGKDGSYKSQYQTLILANATDFEVKEKEKKIYVLKDKIVWEINLQ